MYSNILYIYIYSSWKYKILKILKLKNQKKSNIFHIELLYIYFYWLPLFLTATTITTIIIYYACIYNYTLNSISVTL